MQFFFSPDSKIMQFFSRLTDLILLNVVFLLTCIPVFTIGAANAALYRVCFRMDTDKEEPLFRSYFRSFVLLSKNNHIRKMQLLSEKRPNPADSKKETVSFTAIRNFGVRNESGLLG